MKDPMRPWTAAVVLFVLSCAVRAADLTVEVLNAQPGKGEVLSAVYGSKDTWLQQPAQTSRQSAADRTVLVYRNLPSGTYAVVAYQDHNGNGRLDRNVVGMPTEAFGFSRNPAGLMGPPAFADAGVDLQADRTITIELR